MMDLPPPNYNQTIEAIVKCDIPKANVSIAYEDELQSDEVTISDLGDVSDAKLRCLRAAVHPFYVLTIQDDAQQAAFLEFSRREDRPAERDKALAWVRSRQLLNRLPRYQPEQGLQSYAHAVEAACGLKEGSTLIARGPQSLVVRPEFVLKQDFKSLSASLECLINVFAASDATEQGINLVFLGNEQVADDKKK